MRNSVSFWFMVMAILIVAACEAQEPHEVARQQRELSQFQRPGSPRAVATTAREKKDQSPNLPTSMKNATYLAKPVRLAADGEPIDIGKLSSAAHAAPWIADVDGDGNRDLLVGDLSGDFWFFKNTNDDNDPQYTSRGKLPVGGADASTPVYSGIASSPQFVDYDNDGILDFISGSYYPGDVYLFRGLGDGKYAEVKTILDEDGKPLVQQVGSWPAAVDWDADGDLDILFGSFSGGLYLKSNLGTREEPKYSREIAGINVEGTRKHEADYANPVFADWDDDGTWDLVIGTSNGSVGWYRNIGSVSQPEFGPRNLLVKSAAENLMPEQNLKPYEDPAPGVRAQICVTDYNGDGLQDLIVGSYSDINWNRPLSKEKQAEFEELKQQQVEIVKLIVGDQVLVVRRGYYPRFPRKKEAEHRELHGKLAKLELRKKDLFVESLQASYVWLYLRKSGAEGGTLLRGDAK